jgi:hypothetical protein
MYHNRPAPFFEQLAKSPLSVLTHSAGSLIIVISLNEDRRSQKESWENDLPLQS